MDSSASNPRDPRASRASPWTHRPALLALAPIAGLILAVIVRAPWHSNFDVDTLTHFEQIRSVADHGSVGFDNGPVAGFPELHTRWLIAAHGRAWGIMPAGMSYLLAPAMRLDGYAGCVRAIWLLLGLGAAMVYALTFRLTRRPFVAVAAAWALVCGTSLAFWGSMIAPFVPAACLGITAVYLASGTFEPAVPRRELSRGTAAGFFASAALGCHLLWAFPWAGIGVVLLGAGGSLRARLRRAVAYGVGSAPVLGLMAWVNHQRFNTWSPVSYGPCDAHSCNNPSNNQTATAFLATVRPVLPFVAAFALVAWLSRRSPRAAGFVGFVGACAALIPDTPTRTRLASLLRTTWGYTVDLGNLDMGFPHMDAGPGVFLKGWCVRSLLQCSPVLAAAVLAGAHRRFAPSSERATLALLAVVCVGVLTACTLRADTGGPYVYGYPFLNLRYVAPMLPAAIVLAAAALGDLPWRPWHAPVALAVALGGAWWIASRILGDADLTRRELTHWLPLALAAGTLAATAAWGREGTGTGAGGHLAALIAAVALGWGGAVTLGVDVPAVRAYRGQQDARTAELARCVPEHRFILLGGYAMDEALALHDQRDIYFMNVGMGPRDGSRAMTLVDHALGPHRPAYLIEDEPGAPWQFDWPGFAFKSIPGCPRVQRIVRQSVPTPLTPTATP